MTTPYTFTWHPLERVLEAQLTGAWTLADIEGYNTDLRQQVAARGGETFAFLADLSEFPAQSAPVADAWQANLAQLRASVAFSRSAVVLASRVVSRMQTGRIAKETDAVLSVFPDRDSAFAALAQPVSH